MSDADDPVERPRLPDISLPTADGGAPVPLRARRQGTVLVLLDGAPDDGAREAIRALASHEAALRDWDGRVVVVVPEAASAPGDVPFAVAVDATGRVARAAGVDAPALVVADQWGEVHVASRAWLPPAEVEAWLRMLAIRCAG